MLNTQSIKTMVKQAVKQTVKPKASTDKPIASKRKIYAYNLMRSVSSLRLFNVVGLDKNGELLAVVDVDLEFDDAVSLLDKLNESFKKPVNKPADNLVVVN